MASESWFWRALASEVLRVCWRSFSAMLGAGPCVALYCWWKASRELYPPPRAAWPIGMCQDRGLPWDRAGGCSQIWGTLGSEDITLGEHRALDQEGKATPGIISRFSDSVPALCCDHPWGAAGCLPLATTTPSRMLCHPPTSSLYTKWVGRPW